MSSGNKAMLIVTGLFVAVIALVAGAISFSHMVELAIQYEQVGWKAYAFPISVDGLEIVASLYLVTQKRAGRHTGWVPWTALMLGTVASLSANVAVGGHSVIGRVLAGWPALAMVIAVKLLFGMFEHPGAPVSVPCQVCLTEDDQRTSAPRPSLPQNRTGSDFGHVRPSDVVPNPGAAGDGRSLADSIPVPAVAPQVADVAEMVPAARAAAAALTAAGRRLSRDALADTLRTDGHGVSSARASQLLKILRAEHSRTALHPAGIPERDAA